MGVGCDSPCVWWGIVDAVARFLCRIFCRIDVAAFLHYGAGDYDDAMDSVQPVCEPPGLFLLRCRAAISWTVNLNRSQR